MSDDPEHNAKIVTLQGTALLSTIDVLLEQGLFNQDSSIKNLGLVLSLYIKFTAIHGDEICRDGEHDWRKQVLRMADEHGVEVKGPYGVEEIIQGIRDEMEEDEIETYMELEKRGKHSLSLPQFFFNTRILRPRDKKLTHSLQFNSFSRQQGGQVGGSEYDITKMSEQQRKKFDLGNYSDSEIE